MKKCIYCGQEANDNDMVCNNCGHHFPQTPPPYDAYSQNYDRNNAFDEGPEGKSRGVAALLAILLGGLGIQYFYLGKTTAGFLTILLSIVTCGVWQVLMLIQGILMFCMTNAEFRRKFVLSNSTLPLF